MIDAGVMIRDELVLLASFLNHYHFTNCLIYSAIDCYTFAFLSIHFWPSVNVQQVRMSYSLNTLFRTIYIPCTLNRSRFQDIHQGILRHSAGATPPVSVNVVAWVRAAVLISKRARVTLLHSSSGPLSLITNKVSVCRWHAKHPRMTRFTSEQRISGMILLLLSRLWPSKSLLSTGLLCSTKSCLINGAFKCWSRLTQPFALTWCASH